MNLRYSYLVLILTFLMFSCMDDDAYEDSLKLNYPVSSFNKGEAVLISNEGNYMYGNASLSYYNKSTREIINDVFYRQNALPVGDVLQSVAIRDGLAYLVVNNSGKIYVMNMGKYSQLPAFACVGKITGLISPRYIHFLSDTKAYVTDLYAKAITVINPSTFKITGSISVDNKAKKFYQHSTEQMVQYDKYVFTNCWSYDDKILVINSQTDQVVDSVTVGIQPTSLVIDKNNKIWTLTDGGYEGSPYGHEASSLWKIDAKTRKVEQSFYFQEGSSASELHLNPAKDTLYYINDGIYRMSVKADHLSEDAFISGEEKLFYGINTDPVNGDIYAIDAIDYVQQGVVYRFNREGTPLDTLRVGINPGEATFY